MPVTEFEPPSLQQLKDFTALVEEAKARNQVTSYILYWSASFALKNSFIGNKS